MITQAQPTLHLRDFTENGCAIVPGVMDEPVMARVVSELTPAYTGHEQRGGLRNVLQLAPSARMLAASAAVCSLAESVTGPGARLVRALFFDKTPAANWKVAWHQDLTIAVKEHRATAGFTAWSVKVGIPHVQPPAAVLESMVAVRLHLDAAHAGNGALRVIPGSHRYGRLDANASQRLRQTHPAVLCCAPRGGALLMRPLLLHASSAGTQPTHRRVLHLEFSASMLPDGLAWRDW